MGRYFGTDGIRGAALSVLTQEIAYRIGRYIGQYPDGKANRILIARDTRESGPALLEGLKEGIVRSGGFLFDEGVSTTPSVSYLVENGDFDYGIMISASHNPYSDNGIKLFSHSGEKLSEEIEAKIEDYIDSAEDYLPTRPGHYQEAPELKDKYLRFLMGRHEGQGKVRVLFDCANGSASALAPKLFPLLGIDATFACSDPDGKNINAGCGSTHLENLEKEFGNGDYDLAFAFDGDADRCLGLDKTGRVIDGDAEIFLGALSLREKGLLNGNEVVITVMSNFGLRKALQEEGIGFETVSVGDKYVQARLKQKGLSIGGEQSGHVIFHSDLNTGDGLLTAIKIIGIYMNQPEVFAKLPELKVYPQSLINIRFKDRSGATKALESDSVKAVLKRAEEMLGDDGRMLLRGSGTEPLVRVMGECLDEDRCQKAVEMVAKAIKEGNECAE